MIASHGARLLPEDAIHTVIEELLPVTFLLTPNIPEAILLLSESGHNLHSVRSLADIKQLAKALAGLGPKHVLVKGGHLPLSRTTLFAAEAGISDYEKVIANVLYSSPTDEFHVVMTAYHTSSSTHGTGCSLASAIACQMASSHALVPAIANALDYVEAGIRLAKPLGHGVGPINHFHSIQIMPFAPGNFINYLLRHPLVRPAWKRFTNHPFVCGLSDGTLPRKSFKHYMVQDYLYLTQFARANALAGFKATELQTIGAAAEIVLTIQRETALHLAECEEMGIGRIALEFAREDPACTAYTRYILDVGMQQDYFALQMAMLPCLLGYAYIAARLTEQQPDYIPRSGRASEGARLIAAVRLEAEHEYGNEMHDLPPPMNGGKGENPYRKWIDNYCSDTYVEAVAKGCGTLKRLASLRLSLMRCSTCGEVCSIPITCSDQGAGRCVLPRNYRKSYLPCFQLVR